MVGRQILDVGLIVNEVVDGLLKDRKRGVLCKLDIKKAYDDVDRRFSILYAR